MLPAIQGATLQEERASVPFTLPSHKERLMEKKDIKHNN